MKVLFVSMHYKPEPCDTRTSQLAQSFAARGHQAQVLTSFPNYPFGRTYPGYKQKLRQKECIDGVDVVRVPMVPDHSMSKKKRAISYLSFGTSASILGAVFTRRPNLIWIHHPPLTTGIAGYVLAKIKRVPFVYEIHDLWPETLTSTGMVREGRVTRAIRKVCDFLHARAAAVVVTSPGMKDHLIRQGLAAHKIHVLPQWANDESEAPIDRDVDLGLGHGLAGKFNVMFTGNIGVAQGLDTVLDAAKKLSDLPNLQIVVVGAGVELERLRERATAEGIANVRFTGQVAKEEMPKFFAWADGVLVHLTDRPLFAITIPSKTQVYMSAGKPVLCGVAGDTADLVSSCEGGLCFSPENSHEMADAIRKLHDMSEPDRIRMGRNAREGYLATCGRDAMVTRYEAIFASVLGLPSLAVIEGQQERIREAA